MSRFVVIASVVVGSTVVLLGGMAVARFLDHRPAATPLQGSEETAGLADRLARLEGDLDERLSRLEAASGSIRPERVAEASDAARSDERGVEASGDGEGRPIDLELRIEALELQVRGLSRDPVERGHAFLTSSSAELRRQGIDLLTRLARSDPASREAIRRMLDDADPSVREQALEALEDINDRDAVPRILAMLGDAESDVREQAIRTLLDLLQGRDAAANGSSARLIGALSDPDAGVREEAISALGRLGDRAAISSLRSVYEAGDEAHRLDAATALWRLGDREPFRREASTLVATLSDLEANERDRGRAIQILGSVARDEYREILTRALEDPSERVRREAERALRDRGQRRGR